MATVAAPIPATLPGPGATEQHIDCEKRDVMTNPTPLSIAEEYILDDGEGLIDLRGEGDECGIVIENRPIAITWPDGLGSVGQYIVRSRNRDGISDRLRALREVANHGIRPGISLSSQISPLISLFATGVYTLEYWYAFYPHNVVWDLETWSALDGMNVYPASCQSNDKQIDLIPTQSFGAMFVSECV